MIDKELREKLCAPFKESEVEWRINRVFKSKKATVLCYIQSRAVMDRLDDVFGVGGWQDEYEFIGDNVVCRLAMKVDGEWIYKTDGAPRTDFESFKGGISDALKRAAVKLGIGRYLYNLTEEWVEILPDKKGLSKAKYIKDKSTGVEGYWQPPKLPDWALPAKGVIKESPSPAPKKAERAKPKAKAKAKVESKPEVKFSPENSPANTDHILEGDVKYQGKTLGYVFGSNPQWFQKSNLEDIKERLTNADRENIRAYLIELKAKNKPQEAA